MRAGYLKRSFGDIPPLALVAREGSPVRYILYSSLVHMASSGCRVSRMYIASWDREVGGGSRRSAANACRVQTPLLK